jgi:hypothetical protein
VALPSPSSVQYASHSNMPSTPVSGGFGPHPAVHRYSFNSSARSPPPVASTYGSMGTMPSTYHTQVQGNQNPPLGAGQNLSSPYTPTKSPSSPHMVSLTGSGGMMMIASPRAGLKSSIGHSSLSSSLSHSSTYPNYANSSTQPRSIVHSPPPASNQPYYINSATGPLSPVHRHSQSGVKRTHPEMLQYPQDTSTKGREELEIAAKRISYGVAPSHASPADHHNYPTVPYAQGMNGALALPGPSLPQNLPPSLPGSFPHAQRLSIPSPAPYAILQTTSAKPSPRPNVANPPQNQIPQAISAHPPVAKRAAKR